MIIVEGPDFTGKTTLVKQLSSTLSHMYWHCTATKSLREGLADYHSNVLENAEVNASMGRNMILDRFWPSELCYAPVFNRSLKSYGVNIKSLIRRTEKLNPIYIFCRAADPFKRFAEHNETHEDPMHKTMDEVDYMNVSANYYGLAGEMMSNGFQVFWYDYEREGKFPESAKWLDTITRKRTVAGMLERHVNLGWVESFLKGEEQ